MKALQIYDRVILALAVAAGASLAFATLAIVVDVTLRNTGFRPFQFTSAVVEYIMLFVTVAAAPWLAHIGAHVAINALVSRLPGGLRSVLGRLVIAACVAVLALLAWRAGALTAQEWAFGSVDIRSIAIPGWLAYALLCAGFAFMALEFLVKLLRGETEAGGDGAH
ncbi:TRAP transporter small permease [Oceanicella sp. SM1341]|uniref:TRAP transporter small permease n=1 Tax=Oceanicella sp. SM1341 TaxID=1548889 RepID=UPI000E542E91|nr:TRAP transporter small permease [Oceanicella sp. SM1341]